MSKDRYHAIVCETDRIQKSEGKLSGWEVALKDNISLKGVPCRAGSRILEGYVPVYDATVVRKLEDAGAIITCKTAMDELGMGKYGMNAWYGPVSNPYDKTRICGGSSAGSAALVAGGIVRLALGTDTGDSIRRPASYTGCVGVKPTYGRISRYGIIPYACSLDTVGTFTRNIEDACLALEVLQGGDPMDMSSSVRPCPSYIEHLHSDLKGKRIGIFTTAMERVEDPDLQRCFQSFIDKIQRQGAVLQEVKMPASLPKLIDPVYMTLANAEACSNHANLDGIRFGNSEGDVVKTRSNGFSFPIKKRFLWGAYSLYQKNQEKLFIKAQQIRRILCDAYAGLFEGVDGIVCLSTPDIAPHIEAADEESLDTTAYSHLQLANLSGYPSLSMPLGFKDGMPIGLNLTCRPFEEQTMFDLAKGFENCIGLKAGVRR